MTLTTDTRACDARRPVTAGSDADRSPPVLAVSGARPWWQLAALIAAAALAPPLVSRALPGVLNQYHALVLCFGATYALAALPLNLLMGYAGQISLGHAAFLGVGAYASGIVAGRLGLPFLMGLGVAVVVGALAALVIGLPALRIRGLYLALVTLGFGLAMGSMVFRLRAVTGGYAGVAVPRPQAGAFVFNRNADLLGLIVVIFGVVWALDRNLLRTKVGRAFLALRQDEEVAGALGIDVAGYKLYAFALYGAVAAAAGSVLGHVIGFAQQETFRFDLSLLFIVIVLIGGIRSRLGVALAAFMFGATPRFFGFLRGWELVLAPAFVLLTLVRHPGGLGRALHEMRGLGRRRPVAGGQDRPSPDDSPVSLVLPRPRSSAGNGGALEVQGLVVCFGGVTAVDGISFGVEAGTITGLIGPNGAGKTTAFNAISGFVRPQAGRVLLNGRDISGEPAHRRATLGIGRTFQHIGLIKDLSVSENLVLAQHRLASYNPLLALLHPRPVARAERGLREHAAATLCALGLERFADTPFDELSHGQQRIVELAAGLLTAPGVLLLDEPSAGMSPAAADALAQRLIQVRDELGQTILLIEHNLPLVLATCTVVHVMDAGRLLLTGTPDEVRSSPAVIDAYLGERTA